MSLDRIPTELAVIEAALAVRRDIQAVAAPPALDPSIETAQHALSDMRRSQLGDSVGELYRRAITVSAAAEAVAVNIRIAHPDQEFAA